jgi:MFS transporter, ACS family, allantoate permease
MDKTTLSYASVMVIKTDIHLVGADYQWFGSIFYIRFLAWEVSRAAHISPQSNLDLS